MWNDLTSDQHLKLCLTLWLLQSYLHLLLEEVIVVFLCCNELLNRRLIFYLGCPVYLCRWWDKATLLRRDCVIVLLRHVLNLWRPLKLLSASAQEAGTATNISTGLKRLQTSGNIPCPTESHTWTWTLIIYYKRSPVYLWILQPEMFTIHFLQVQ